jgi:hypothetical protein
VVSAVVKKMIETLQTLELSSGINALNDAQVSFNPKRTMNLEIQIQKHIEELIANSDSDLADLRGVARLLKALPIFPDMSGCLALRPDGSFIFLDDSTGKTTEEIDLKFKLVGLVNGSEKYPELKVLLPVRPENAPDCEDCKATGRGIFEGQVFNNIFCGQCFGLGWKP